MPRQAPLVSQYIERISRDAVEKYQDLFQQYVSHRQGVYALYRRDKLYYVGLASNLKWRLYQHLNDHHRSSWDRFSVYFTIGDKHLKELETLVPDARPVAPRESSVWQTAKRSFMKSIYLSCLV